MEEGQVVNTSLEGKVALVTGSSVGVGRAIALRLAQAGADVMVNSRREERIRPVAEEIAALGRRSVFHVADLLDGEQIKAMVDRAAEEFGRLDIVVANGAGATKMTLPWRFFHEMDPDFMLGVVLSTWLSKAYLIRAALDHMIPQGSGKIINISTDAGRTPTVGESLIGGGAAGLMLMTRVVARETGRYGIRINTLSTGPLVDNPIDEIEGYSMLSGQGDAPGATAKVSPKLQSRRMFPVAMHDLAEATLYLAAETGDNITGQTWSVNGGISMPS